MARAFSRVSAASVPLMAKPFYHEASETYFSIVRRGPLFLHRRWQKGTDRKEINVEELEIHYVMGSGNHARTFLHRNARGALVELPLGWYAEKGGYFAMNPGFDSPRPETRRKIDFDCMACHNSYPNIKRQQQKPGAEPIFEGDLPEGIDCQRCHGPASRHVELAKTAGAGAAAIRGSIVNPARLPPERQAEVCLQCHLETTSTQLPGMIRRFDRPPFSYKPGEPLGNYVLYFDHAPGSGREDKFEIVNAAYRMRQSKCFLQSAALTCTTCHSPHAKAQAPNQTACLACHAADTLSASPQHLRDSDCASCHMPKRRTEDVVHVVMTDHKIRRQPLADDPLAERMERHPSDAEDYQGEVVPYYPAPFQRSGEDAIYLALAQVLHESNLKNGIEQLEKQFAAQRPKEAEFLVALGNAWERVQRPEKAAGAFQEAVPLRPDSARERRFLGIALMEAGNKEQAAVAFQNAIALDPSDAVSWYQLALLDSERGRASEAAEKAARSIALDPDLLDARNSLGVNRTELGDVAGAETAFREALRVNPYFATAHGNLARLLGSHGDVPGALEHFAKAVRLRAEFAPDRYDYAVTLARANRFAESREQAQEAVRLAPGMVDARILLGGLFARDGQMTAARQEYEAALKAQPEHGRAHLDLARVLIAQGDRAGAAAHLRLAAKGNDPASARLAAQALKNLGETHPAR